MAFFFLGKLECKINNDKIGVQKVVCRILNRDNKLILKKNISHASFSNISQIKDFFQTSENNWIFKYLKTEEKNVICQQIVEDNDISFILNFVEIRDVFEKIVLLEFKSISEAFKRSKNSAFNQIDFSCELENDEIIELIGQSKENIKKCSVDIISKILLILKSMPIAFCSKELKTKVSLLLLCLYKDLVSANEQQSAGEVLDLLLDILHFGKNVVLHKYLTFKVFINLISPKKYPTFYSILFNNLKLDIEAGKKFFETAVDHIKKMDKEDESYFELLNLCINYLSSPLAYKDSKKYLEDLHIIVWKNVEDNFNTGADNDYERTRVFVEKSLPSFCNYFNSYFNKLQKDSEMDENMRKICKIYIGNSVSFLYFN